MCYTHIWSYPILPISLTPNYPTIRAPNIKLVNNSNLHNRSPKLNPHPYGHVLYPYMAIWPCVIPIYGHMARSPKLNPHPSLCLRSMRSNVDRTLPLTLSPVEGSKPIYGHMAMCYTHIWA